MGYRTVAVFDLGGVLVDWNPRHLYRKLFAGDEDAMEDFLANVCTPSWNAKQDAGRSFAEGCSSLKSQFPKCTNLIDAWFERQEEMLAGPISGTVEILAELRARGFPLYALSNWSAETFPIAQRRFEFLRWFQGIMLSGEVRLLKPDPRIFRLLFEQFSIDPTQAVYIDDIEANAKAARALGMHGIVFTNPRALREELVRVGWLQAAGQLDHVAAWVGDLERARAFYERWFNAKAGPEYSRRRSNFQSCFISLGSGPRIELMAMPSEAPRPAHIAVCVGSRGAVDGLITAMEAAGVSIISRPRVTGDGYYEAVVADSEGNLVEITA